MQLQVSNRGVTGDRVVRLYVELQQRCEAMCQVKIGPRIMPKTPIEAQFSEAKGSWYW